MFKRILALIATLILWLTFSAVAAGETCTHADTRASFSLKDQIILGENDLHHAFSSATVVYREVCRLCGQTISQDDNYDVLTNIVVRHDFVDGACITCEHANQCLHRDTAEIDAGYEDVSFTSNNKQTHTVNGSTFYYTYQCQDCGEQVGKRYSRTNVSLVEPHVFENNVCKLCRYTTTCKHTKTETDYVYHLIFNPKIKDSSQHTFTAYATEKTICSSCGEVRSEIKPEKTSTYTAPHHINSQGYCPMCGYANAKPRITLSAENVTLNIGKSFSLSGKSSTNESVKYKSSNTKVVTVSSTGKITAKGSGIAYITAYIDGASARCTVMVPHSTGTPFSVNSADKEKLTYLCMSHIASSVSLERLLTFIDIPIPELVRLGNLGTTKVWTDSTWGTRTENILRNYAYYGDLYMACLGDWIIEDVTYNEKNEYIAVIFNNAKDNASVIAYGSPAGLPNLYDTLNGDDWDTFLVYTTQYPGKNFERAYKTYTDLRKREPSRDITLTGHLMGGGLALAVSTVAQDVPARTFNSSPVFSNIFSQFPAIISRDFKGIDKLDHIDYINEHDVIAGLWDTDYMNTALENFPSYKYTKYINKGIAISAQNEWSKNHVAYKDYVLTYDNFISAIQNCATLSSLFTLAGDEFRFNPQIHSHQYTPLSSAAFEYRIWNDTTDFTSLWGIEAPDYTPPLYARAEIGGSGNQVFFPPSPDKDTPAVHINDIIYGGNGDDIIGTQEGIDHLIGGFGNDTLSGGTDKDHYLYVKGHGLDTIADLEGDVHVYLIGFTGSDSITYKTFAHKTTDALGKTVNYHVVYNHSSPILYIRADRVANKIGDTSPWLYIHNGEKTIQIREKKSNNTTQYTFYCPISIQIYDSEGNHVSTIGSGTETIDIKPFGQAYVFQEANGSYGKTIKLFDGYSLIAEGENSGVFSITVKEVFENDINAYGAANMTVQKGSKITFSGDSPSNMVVSIDHDNDGTVDEIMQLTSNLQGAPLSELPQTGDNTPYAFYVTALAVSASLFFLLKKRNRA